MINFVALSKLRYKHMILIKKYKMKLKYVHTIHMEIKNEGYTE